MPNYEPIKFFVKDENNAGASVGKVVISANKYKCKVIRSRFPFIFLPFIVFFKVILAAFFLLFLQ